MGIYTCNCALCTLQYILLHTEKKMCLNSKIVYLVPYVRVHILYIHGSSSKVVTQNLNKSATFYDVVNDGGGSFCGSSLQSLVPPVKHTLLKGPPC